MEKNKFTHGSLFSGIGGPEIAAEEMGWKNMFHCEINPFGRKILDYWFPNSKSYEDITKTNSTGYYIAVLNQWFCPKCYQAWYHRATYYPEDAKVENRNFEFYKNIFGL